MSTFNVVIIVLVLFVVICLIIISLIYQYLITTNKIEVSKISKIFYADDESFIKYWRITQEEGLLRYIIKKIVSMTVMISIFPIIAILYKPNIYSHKQTKVFFLFLLLSVGCGLINSSDWGKNHNRYSRLIQKVKMKSDTISNDNKKS